MTRSYQQGLTLIEIVIAMALGATLLGMAVVSFREWIQNAQIRTAAESIQNGLQLARAEAVRRNNQVRFQFSDTLDNACAISVNGPHWVVSENDPTGACANPASDTVAPFIIQTRSAQEGSSNTALVSQEMTPAGAVAVAPTYTGAIAFNGLGRVAVGLGAGNSLRIDISHPDNPGGEGPACAEWGGDVRCLRVVVSNNGQIRMCDPAVKDGGPQGCQ